MSKNNQIMKDIKRCNDFLVQGSYKEIDFFIKEMIAVYGTEITGFTSHLHYKSIDRLSSKETMEELKEDVKLIEAMLSNYNENIRCGLINMNGDSSISINNTSISQATSNVKVNIEQTINMINNISDSELNSSEKEELEEKIRALESIVNSDNKDKIKDKLMKLFNYALEKGPRVICLVSQVIYLLQDKILPLFE